ncbi:hypothetical protein [Clostridium sp.]|uniref:hypothetical protein n=1 Tax=Clostridium sp. TaxID=1506 RepID=UPI001DF5F6D1|nr:hypothetical protein [Clostridium sp.]MBS5937748.1 hypothetical protein [Clostridium sp.]
MKVNIDESIISLEKLWEKIDKMSKKPSEIDIDGKVLAKNIVNEIKRELDKANSFYNKLMEKRQELDFADFIVFYREFKEKHNAELKELVKISTKLRLLCAEIENSQNSVVLLTMLGHEESTKVFSKVLVTELRKELKDFLQF